MDLYSGPVITLPSIKDGQGIQTRFHLLCSARWLFSNEEWDRRDMQLEICGHKTCYFHNGAYAHTHVQYILHIQRCKDPSVSIQVSIHPSTVTCITESIIHKVTRASPLHLLRQSAPLILIVIDWHRLHFWHIVQPRGEMENKGVRWRTLLMQECAY